MDLGVGSSNTKKAQLSLRVDRPLQGCAMNPFTLLHSYERRHQLGQKNKNIMQFKWSRSIVKQICQNKKCPQAVKYVFTVYICIYLFRALLRRRRSRGKKKLSYFIYSPSLSIQKYVSTR